MRLIGKNAQSVYAAAILCTLAVHANAETPRDDYLRFKEVVEGRFGASIGDDVFDIMTSVSLGSYQPTDEDYCQPVISSEILGSRDRVSFQWDLTRVDSRISNIDDTSRVSGFYDLKSTSGGRVRHLIAHNREIDLFETTTFFSTTHNGAPATIAFSHVSDVDGAVRFGRIVNGYARFCGDLFSD